MPHPAKGTTIAVALSSPPSSSENARMRSAAILGLEAPLARSTISSSERMDEMPSEMRTTNAHSFPGFDMSIERRFEDLKLHTLKKLGSDFRFWSYPEFFVAKVTQT